MKKQQPDRRFEVLDAKLKGAARKRKELLTLLKARKKDTEITICPKCGCIAVPEGAPMPRSVFPFVPESFSRNPNGVLVPNYPLKPRFKEKVCVNGCPDFEHEFAGEKI